MQGIEKTQIRCVACGSEAVQALILLDQDGVPPAQECHAILYMHTVVGQCSVCGAGLVERYEHDCFDWEDLWNEYEWYELDASDMKRLLIVLQDCPAPLSPQCTCPIHDALRSSYRSLPWSPWSDNLDARLHRHKVSLQIEKGVPTLRLRE